MEPYLVFQRNGNSDTWIQFMRSFKNKEDAIDYIKNELSEGGEYKVLTPSQAKKQIKIL